MAFSDEEDGKFFVVTSVFEEFTRVDIGDQLLDDLSDDLCGDNVGEGAAFHEFQNFRFLNKKNLSNFSSIFKLEIRILKLDLQCYLAVMGSSGQSHQPPCGES